ncbi:uncharacterized protein LOC143962744 isoform X2 [Lithobates pipiens]
MYQSNANSGNVLFGRRQRTCQRLVFNGHNRFQSYSTLTPYRSQTIPKKTCPFYFKFVNSATLWDRGLYHYTHRPENERQPELCPRFISHMAPSPQQQHHARAESIKSASPSGNVRNRPRKILPNANSRWNTSGGRQRQTSNVILPNVSKQPVPSEASSDGESDVTGDDVHCAVLLGDDVIYAELKTEECNNSTTLITAPEIARCSKVEETEIHSSCMTIEPDQHQSMVPLNESGSTCTAPKDPDLSERASSCSSIYKSFSASFSQLRTSLSSLSSKSKETFKSSSSIATTVHDRKSPPAASGCGSSAPSPGLYTFSESSNLGETLRQSAVSEFSDNDQDAFDELDMLTPHTRSFQSLENAQSESCGDCSSDSDICKYTASLTIGLSDPEESLADLRLSLLDHTGHGNDNYNAENSTKWDDNLVILSHRKIKEFLTFSKKGPPSPPTPGPQNAADTSDTYSYEWENEQQHTSTISTSNEENQQKIREYLQHPSKAHTNPSHTMDTSVCSETCSSNIIKGSQPSEGEYEDRDAIFSADSAEELRPQFLRRRKLVVLDLSIRQEMERQRIAEERRAQAINMYSKLRNSRPTMGRTAQSMSISRFEDFDFLAKYCIFSQEKLAEYKRAFEAVDTDEDGYLDCLQVLMALKEIVPSNALSDAEELYVYRILEIVDYYVTDGLTDLRLFAVMASLAQKIAALDSFMRSLIDHMDFKALELKMCKAKQLFLCNIDAESKSISVDQLLVELKAGGISREHEEAAQLQLSHIKKLDILDFLTYLPLFVLIHNSVISNPLDDTRKI